MTGILALHPAEVQRSEVVVGSSLAGHTDGTGKAALCSEPCGIVFARLDEPLLPGGNGDDILLVGETAALRAAIRAPGSHCWSVTTLAGGGDDRRGFDDGKAAGPAAAGAARAWAARAQPLARLARLDGVCYIAAGSTGSIFFTEFNSNSVRELRLAAGGGGTVITLGGRHRLESHHRRRWASSVV